MSTSSYCFNENELYGDYYTIRKIIKVNNQTSRVSYIENPHNPFWNHKIKSCSISSFKKWVIDKLN
jgi:hypothetical protein